MNKPEKKFTFRIPAHWEMCGEVNIKASSLEEAIEIANDIDFAEFDVAYVDSSFEINEDILTDYLQNRIAMECCKIESTPEKDLPLLIGTIKTDQGETYLKEKLKGINHG